jgi:hypothetical protein
MNKTERNKTINKLVYHIAEQLGYEVDMTEIDVNFISPSGNMDDHIEYRRSSHSLAALNWACAKTKMDVQVMEAYIDIVSMLDDDGLVEHMRAVQK